MTVIITARYEGVQTLYDYTLYLLGKLLFEAGLTRSHKNSKSISYYQIVPPRLCFVNKVSVRINGDSHKYRKCPSTVCWQIAVTNVPNFKRIYI